MLSVEHRINTRMPTLLQQQLVLYEQVSEKWNAEFRDEVHERRVAQRRQLSRLLEFGLFLYDQICRIDQDWSNDSVQPQPQDPAVEPAAEIQRLYRWWCKPCDRLLAQVRELETKGYPLHVAEKFRQACAAARIKVGWDLERIASADAQLKLGGGRGMDEVFNELQGRPDGRGD
jgi:hypothetical protein